MSRFGDALASAVAIAEALGHSTVVVFPAPFGPSTPEVSPASTSRETSPTATTSAYRFVRSSRAITGTSPLQPPGSARCARPASARTRASSRPPQLVASSLASSGEPIAIARTSGSIRRCSFVSVSPTPASTIVVAPAATRERAQSSHRTGDTT